MSVETVTQTYSTAGITPAAPWRIRSVSVLPSYRLSVICNDGRSGIVDMSALVTSENAGIFSSLHNELLFNQVGLELGALTWPNGVDLDPEWIHEELGKQACWVVAK